MSAHAASGAIAALDGQIDELVYRLYGLTAEEIAIVEGGRSRMSVEQPVYIDVGLTLLMYGTFLLLLALVGVPWVVSRWRR